MTEFSEDLWEVCNNPSRLSVTDGLVLKSTEIPDTVYTCLPSLATHSFKHTVLLNKGVGLLLTFISYTEVLCPLKCSLFVYSFEIEISEGIYSLLIHVCPNSTEPDVNAKHII